MTANIRRPVTIMLPFFAQRVLKKLVFLGRVSSDPETRKRAKERAECLKGQPSCKIPREKEKL